MSHSVVVADDHGLVRAGLVGLIEDIADFDVVGEANNGLEALDLTQQLIPDIALLDIHMPTMNGIECLERIKQTVCETHVLMLSMYSNEEHVLRALELGASGYLIKDSSPDELELALKSILGGNTWLSAAVSPSALEQYTQQNIKKEYEELLTPRQVEVFKQLAEGQSVKQIAFTMNLSIKTIETYRAQIMHKLEFTDLASLIRYAIRNGIIPL